MSFNLRRYTLPSDFFNRNDHFAGQKINDKKIRGIQPTYKNRQKSVGTLKIRHQMTYRANY